ncbi:hypothetical protein PTTG_25937 [Puccinia triticina 1-1 BBBD Race 1]|uniref:Uncharacterized protein n=1 Tax=Puccinia triticina (isolate 1-1 / race 1 (BBBD)) TaxID=630390 RepID=A0A180GZF5_PUCT1|nr:hypothetical protein PTTG_25937 [Puccinia triticina 1-1 BBBD Race 1]
MDIPPTTHTGAPKRKREVCPDSQIPYAEFKESLTMDEVREQYPVADDTSTRAHQSDVELEINKSAMWDWKCVRAAILAKITERDPGVGHEARCNNLAGELDWTVIHLGPPLTPSPSGTMAATNLTWPLIIPSISDKAPGKVPRTKPAAEKVPTNVSGQIRLKENPGPRSLKERITVSAKGKTVESNQTDQSNTAQRDGESIASHYFSAASQRPREENSRSKDRITLLSQDPCTPPVSQQEPPQTPLEGTSNLSQPGLSLIVTKDVTKEVPDLSSGTVHLNQRLARAHQIHPARGMNPMIEVTIMYTLYVPFGKDTRGQVYSQLWETSEPPRTIRLGLTELDFNGLKDKIWEHLSEENRIQRVDLVAKASDRADRLIWSFTANSSSQAKVVIEVCMPQDYEVITPLPQETEWSYSRVSHPVLPVLCGPSPSAPRPQAANPSPSAFRPNTPIGPLQAPVVDANGSPHATRPKKELLDLSIDGFLSYCRIPLKDKRVDQVIYDQQILHWTSFIGQTHNSLEALGFGWGVRDLILRGLERVKKELNI